MTEATNEKKLFMQVTDENEELNQKLKNPWNKRVNQKLKNPTQIKSLWSAKNRLSVSLDYIYIYIFIV